MMVDVLAAANIRFDIVVGHSSGEIAAAYAAGYLSARDTILVAYFRGLHCKEAASPNGEEIRGAMLAAGTCLEDAKELCQSEEFDGRVVVAASNSPDSVTFSGDEDAIEELAIILEDEKKFHRRLRVDQAYHSGHMLPCAEPYAQSLRRAGVKAQQRDLGRPPCTWFSSVHGGRPVDAAHDALGDEYWAQNMTQPVLFFEALSAAISTAPLAAAVEVGPHPSLAGPAEQTIQQTLKEKLPYRGCLSRKTDARQGLAACLAFLWELLDPAAGVPALRQCQDAVDGREHPRAVLKSLPPYPWKHDARYWQESRRSRCMRLRDEPFHPLLGNMVPDSATHALRWSNVLKASEMPWLEGHRVQGQIVFPAAGYVATAVEAARFLVPGPQRDGIRIIELSRFSIHNAIALDADDAGIEVHVELARVAATTSGCITACFSYSAALGAHLELAAGGEVKVWLGEGALDLLPRRLPSPPHVIPVEPDRLYGFLASLEYSFSGPFRSLESIERKLGRASCVARKANAPSTASEKLLIHPAELDAAFQSVMLAYSYPGDDRLRLLHLPTSIETVRVNPAVLTSSGYVEDDYHDLCSTSHAPVEHAEPGAGFSGDVSLYTSSARESGAAVQVKQIRFKPVGSGASYDRNVFYKMRWLPAKPDGKRAADKVPVTKQDEELRWVLSRIATFYLRQFDEIVPPDSLARQQSPNCHYLNYARHMTDLLRRGEHRWAREEWLNDSLQNVMDDIKAKR
ncbi:hypothetical protein CDD83_3112 [Cordyceps sp. RAO-2017]|nr:hypothetical protein CDD83_3112 [Cordyceps sp. RAO-2017]